MATRRSVDGQLDLLDREDNQPRPHLDEHAKAHARQALAAARAAIAQAQRKEQSA